MIILFLVLIVVASVAIAFFILVQNPKGGGLAGSIGGINSQYMGVKQTTDVLEKGTWVLAAVIGLLCLFSAFFIPRNGTAPGGSTPGLTAPANTTAPVQPQVPVQQTTPAATPQK